MGITKDYFAIQKHFEEKYGEHTIALMQIGSFYEVYEYDPTYAEQQITSDVQKNVALKFSLKSGNGKVVGVKNGDVINVNTPINNDESIGHALDISLVLNMRLTSKNKEKPHSMDNPLLVGFPCSVYETHRDLILFHGFTIVRIDQKDKSADGENVEREVVEISSPGTEIDNSIILQPTGTNTIVSIYIECQRSKRNFENNMILCGLSSIDVSTGRNIICEVYSKENDEIYATHEIYRFLTAQKPIEVLLNVDKIPNEQATEYMSYLNSTLELDRYLTKVIKCNKLDPNYLKDEYQEEMFRKAFDYTPVETEKFRIYEPIVQPGTTSIVYQMDLENFTYGRISYVALLQYCYEHNENIIKKLQKPQVSWTDKNDHLIMAHNAMLQLDLFPKSNDGYIRRNRQKVVDSLISVVDSTSTPIGARYLRRQLLSPITDPTRLELIYAMTHELMCDEELTSYIDGALKKMPDIEKFQRKIQIGLIRPKELVTLFRGYSLLRQIYITIFQKCISGTDKYHLKSLFMNQKDVDDFNDCLKETSSVINIDKLDRVRFISRIGGKQQRLECDDSFICPGIDLTIDQIQQSLQQYQNWIQNICNHLNGLLTARVKKIEPIFERSKPRKEKEEENEDESSGDMTVYLSATSATSRQLRSAHVNQQLCGALVFQEINKTKIMVTSDVIKQCCQGIETYQTMLECHLLTKFYEVVGNIAQRSYFSGLNNFIGLLDFLKSNVQTALRYKYFRPCIDTNSKSPFLEIKNLRHPLIERIIRSEYVPNNLSLGELSPNGLLLFGVNSTGKSSFAKALGCIVMMAQAGLYVPCNLRYKPFSKIITRLSGDDNLLKGQSSFVVEMSELRTILRGADIGTLVLGDELCRGTESRSGASLISATIQTLIEGNVKFISSTHMHHLPKIPLIKKYCQESKLRIAHLTAFHDESLDRLVYNRKLEDGPGSSQYGLEVCKSLGIDKNFIELANSIRRQLDDIPDLFYSTKKSKYNSKIYVDRCQLCNSVLDLQTHHLQEQTKADSRGYIKHYHKDSPFNLLILCESCHQKLHHVGNNVVKKETLEGSYLTVEPIICASNIGDTNEIPIISNN